jgi:hypothetical protein
MKISNPLSTRPIALEHLESRRMLASSISGMVFNDANADGVRQASEAGLARQRVYLDANFNGRFERGEASQLTKTGGTYAFAGLGAGIYRVRVEIPQNNRQTPPGLSYYDVPANGADIHVANDFGLTTTAIVRGTVFNDTNGDGIQQIIERGISGVRVFIDKNRNGKWDRSERSRITNDDGDYRFAGLSAGVHVIRIVKPAGTTITAPASGAIVVKLKKGQSLSNRDFGIKSIS